MSNGESQRACGAEDQGSGYVIIASSIVLAALLWVVLHRKQAPGAEEQEMASKEQEKDRLSSEAKQKENDAKQENLGKRPEIEMEELKSRKQNLKQQDVYSSRTEGSLKGNFNENSGEALKLYNFDKEGHLELNDSNLQRVLNATNGLPIKVVSVVGAFRGGKSFLLNIIMLYLEKNGKEGWFDDPAALIKGFTSKQSMATVTTGVDVWSKPFIIKTKRGKEIAVILLDTQGTNDLDATKSQFTRIFALSTLQSDVQVYNLRNNIGSNDVDQLTYFLEFAKYAKSSVSTRKLLVMLVRDWQSSSNFGFVEGHKYLTQKVMRKSEHAGPASLHEAIYNFMEVKCCLLPSPGEKIIKQPEFQGPTSDLDPQFCEHVVELVEELFDRNLAEGKNSEEYSELCHSLVERFKSTDLPAQSSLIEMEAERMCLKARDHSLELFLSAVRTQPSACSQKCMSQDELKKLCSDAKATAFEIYDKEREGFDVKEIREKVREYLMDLIASEEKYLLKRNEEDIAAENKRWLDDLFHTCDAKMRSTTETLIEEMDFSATFEKIQDQFMQQSSKKGIDAKLLGDLKLRLEEQTRYYQTENEKKLNERNTEQGRQHYKDGMNELCNHAANETEFKIQSRKIYEKSYNLFKDKFVGPKQMRDYFLHDLRGKLAELEKIWEERNHKNVQERMKEMEERQKKEQQKKAEEEKVTLQKQKEAERLQRETEERERQARRLAQEQEHKAEMEKKRKEQQSSSWLKRTCAGFVAGAGAGAATGSLFGLAGAVPGAVVGGVLGALGGANA